MVAYVALSTLERPYPNYADRIRERARLWWGKDQSFRERAHRLRELMRRHRPEDSDEAWRCCELWRRTLQNKLNGKAFAEKYGARVPKTYWSGRCPQSIPWSRLPEELVVKPLWGFAGKGSYVISQGREHLKDVPMTRGQLIDVLDDQPPILWRPLLIEEHVRRPDGSWGLPRDCKIYVFRDRVEALTTRTGHEKTLGFYTADWELLPESATPLELAPKEKPDCFDEMLDTALRLGAAYAEPIRVDFFWTDQGCIFNEFSSAPGHGYGYSDFASKYLGDCWQQMIERFSDASPDTSTARTG